jgi:hypothetical protein
MSKLKLEDFDGLSIPQLEEKLEKVTDMKLLSDIEKNEKADGDPRKGALAAINERQGVLYDEQKKDTPESKTPAPAPPSPSPEPVKDEDSDAGKTDNQKLKSTEEEKADTKKQLIKKVRDARYNLDKNLELIKGHLRIDNTPERSLFLSKSWLGKFLGFVGTKNPYDVKGGVKDETQIPPTAEKFEGTDAKILVLKFGNKDSLAAVLELREDIQDIIDFIEGIDINSLEVENPRELAICRTQAWVNSCEARFYLGEILSSLRR